MPLPPAQWQSSLVLDSVLTTSMINFMPQLQENVLTNNFLYWWLFTRDRIKTLDGGESIAVPLMYGLNETVKSYSDYDPLDVSPQDGMTPARFQWKQLAGTISISRKEERQNAGKTRIMSLMEAKAEQLEMSYQQKLGEMIFKDGTGNSGKDFLGLQALVEDGGTFGTLGGIDGTANPWWQNQQAALTDLVGDNDFDETTSAATGDVIGGITGLRIMYLRSTVQKQQPDLGITYVDTFGEYEAALSEHQRHVDKEVGNHGFMNVKFKNMVVSWEDQFISDGAGGFGGVGLFYLLNSRFLGVTLDTETNFLQTPFVRPHNQDARSSQTLLMGNMTVSNRSRQGVIDSIT